MARRAMLALSLLVVLSGCTSPQEDAAGDARSPYVEQLSGSVRGLSAEEVADLRSGAGMGLARPAELNGYPGPLHVLELQDELALSDGQRDTVKALREDVVRRASLLGEEIVKQYASIEASFRNGTLDADALRSELAVLEGLYADLRFVHLNAHLETWPVLSEHQRVRYMELRGYTAPGEHAHVGH